MSNQDLPPNSSSDPAHEPPRNAPENSGNPSHSAASGSTWNWGANDNTQSENYGAFGAGSWQSPNPHTSSENNAPSSSFASPSTPSGAGFDSSGVPGMNNSAASNYTMAPNATSGMNTAGIGSGSSSGAGSGSASGSNAAYPSDSPGTHGLDFRQIQPGIIPLRPLTISDILNGTVAAVRQAPSVMLGLVLAFYAVLTLITGFLMFFLSPDYYDFMAQLMVRPDRLDGLTPDDLISLTGGTVVAAAVSQLLQLLLSCLCTGICAAAVATLVLGRRPSVSQAWNSSKAHLGQILLYSLVIIGISLAALTLLALPLMLIISAIATENGASGLLGALLFLLAMVAETAVLLFLMVKMLFAIPAIVMENITVGAAIKRSWSLSRGHFWRILGVYLLVSILLLIITGMLSGGAGIITAVFLVTVQNLQLQYILDMALSTLISGIVVPFTAALTTLLYLDVRMRKEGLALSLLQAAHAQ